MAAKTTVAVEQYLRMGFDGPDREFVDGEIVERNVGEKPHSKAQVRLILLLDRLRGGAPLYIHTELRLQLASSRYRIPDICVFAGDEPAEDVPSTAPLATIEIVSRDDRYTEIIQKLEEYRQWGVPHIWLVDPWLKKLYVFSSTGLAEVAAFELPECNSRIPASEVFA